MDKPDENTPLGRLTIFAAETNDYTIRAAQFRPDVRVLLDALASRPSHLVDTGEALREALVEARRFIANCWPDPVAAAEECALLAKIDAALAAHPKPEEG